jgi:hypothetical protein
MQQLRPSEAGAYSGCKQYATDFQARPRLRRASPALSLFAAMLGEWGNAL